MKKAIRIYDQTIPLIQSGESIRFDYCWMESVVKIDDKLKGCEWYINHIKGHAIHVNNVNEASIWKEDLKTGHWNFVENVTVPYSIVAI